MSAIWIYIGGGVAIVVVGVLVRPRIPLGMKPESRAQEVRQSISAAICFVGVALVGVSVYAGVKGPLDLGLVELPKFGKAISKYLPKEATGALGYARRKMTITATADIDQNSRAYRSVRFNVRNKGDRRIGFVTVQLQATGKGSSGLNVRLEGPFKPGQVSKVSPKIPPNQLARFKSSGRSPKLKVVSATFN